MYSKEDQNESKQMSLEYYTLQRKFQYISEECEIFHNNFIAEDKLSGNYDRLVLKVVSLHDGRGYAVKRIKTNQAHRRVSNKEAVLFSQAEKILSRVGPSRLYIASWTEQGNIFIQMRLMQSNLSNVCLSCESQLITVLKEVGKQLSLLHDNNFIHMDVKPGKVYERTY